jgi:hypothetical protein
MPAPPRGKSARRTLLNLRTLAVTLVLVFVAQPGSFAQRMGGGRIYVPPGAKTAREVESRSTGTPEWENPPGFHGDVFTFARLRYDSASRQPNRGTRVGGWWDTDLPDADLNLSYRLQQMTALKVDPASRLVRATDEDLSQYPFLFASAPGSMSLSAEEIVGLRKYLLNGGFMLMTDYWGEDAEANVERLFAQILPGFRFEELPIEHPLYRSVFQIREKVAVPNINMGLKVSGTQVHHRVIFDPKGRIMVIGLHNSDDSDGWEREGENHEYFEKFSEKVAYPLAINIIVYIMTH